MTPGCVIISEGASKERRAARWGHRAGLLDWVGCDRSLASARDAITEQVTAIDPSQRVSVALYALSMAGTTRLLVRRKPSELPEGLITDFDLAVATRR